MDGSTYHTNDTATKRTPHPDRRLSWTKLKDVEARVSDRYLIKNLVGCGTFVEVFGDSNCGKTVLVCELALHIAMGWSWRGRKVKRGAVLYIAAEGGHGINNRFAGLKRHLDIPLDEDIPLGISPEPIDLRTVNDPDAIIRLVREAEKAWDLPVGLIIVDTLSRALAGGDENAPADMGKLVHNVDRIRAAAGATVLVVHHTGKSDKGQARGHSLLRGAVDTEILVKLEDDVSVAEVKKQRDLPRTGEKFAFSITSVEIGTDDDGDPVTAPVAEPAVIADEPCAEHTKRKGPPAKAKKAYDALVDALADPNRPMVSGDDPRTTTMGHWWDNCVSSGLLQSGDGRDVYKRKHAEMSRYKKQLTEAGWVRMSNDKKFVTDIRSGGVGGV